MYDQNITDDQAKPVLAALRLWAHNHPARDQPFMAMMFDFPDQVITPLEFLDNVEKRTHLGLSFMRFVFNQAEEYRIPAADFVYRAVEANRFRAIDESAP